jgi:hypothetical protein
MKRAIKTMMAALAAALSGAAAAAGGLTPGNFVEVGDTIVDMLDTSALAYSTMQLGVAEIVRPSRVSAGVPTESFSTPCPGGGSISGSIADRDASGDVSVQDRFVTVFKSCRIDDELVTGSSEFTITSYRVENEREITELAFRFHHLGSDAMRWTGPATAVLSVNRKTGSERYAVSYQNLLVTRGSVSTHWNLTLETRRPPLGDQTTQISGSMTLDHAVLHLLQGEVFVVAPGGRPRSGRLTATDADGDRLEVEADGRRYRYRFFDHGNRGDTPDARSQSKAQPGS